MAQKKIHELPRQFFSIESGEERSYDDHPFFVKKKNDAMAFLKKHGLPRNLTKEQLGFEQVWNEERKEWDFVKDGVVLN